MWGGGRYVENGYVHVMIPEHPHANRKGCVLEHRLVMEGVIGRYLTTEEVVHHKNDDTQDNRPDSLKLFPNQAAHKTHEHAERARDKGGRYLPTEARL